MSNEPLHAVGPAMRPCEIPRGLAETRGPMRSLMKEFRLAPRDFGCHALTLPRVTRTVWSKKRGNHAYAPPLAAQLPRRHRRRGGRGMHTRLPVLRDRQGLPRQGILRRAQVSAMSRLEGLPGGSELQFRQVR